MVTVVVGKFGGRNDSTPELWFYETPPEFHETSHFEIILSIRNFPNKKVQPEVDRRTIFTAAKTVDSCELT